MYIDIYMYIIIHTCIKPYVYNDKQHMFMQYLCTTDTNIPCRQ